MVWNSTQSSLYRAVNKYNGEADCSPEHEYTEAPKQEQSQPQSQTQPRSQSRDRAKQQPVRGANTSIIQNPDFILIAALIFILLRENADKGLILALAMTLFN